jgi:hypothetical protein
MQASTLDSPNETGRQMAVEAELSFRNRVRQTIAENS